MQLPFSRPEFFQVFSDYNESIWPSQIIAAVLGLVGVLLLFSHKSWADRSIAAILAALWATTGIGYHWMFFARINGAAYLFGSLFLIAASIFLVEGTFRNRIRFELSQTVRGWLAVSLIVYSLVVYPLLGLLVTHPYPETPLFGVVPCPTTIFTLGLLIAASHPRPMLLAVIPLLWAVIGGTAAFLLEVAQDWGLVIAGLIWLATFIERGKRRVSRPTG